MGHVAIALLRAGFEHPSKRAGGSCDRKQSPVGENKLCKQSQPRCRQEARKDQWSQRWQAYPLESKTWWQLYFSHFNVVGLFSFLEYDWCSVHFIKAEIGWNSIALFQLFSLFIRSSFGTKFSRTLEPYDWKKDWLCKTTVSADADWHQSSPWLAILDQMNSLAQ